jgi:digalactosyldiacylglycerol synthase
MGDITALVSADDIDICILEEPEHLNWYRAPGEHWTEKFKHVVGIIHTNYFAYAQEQPAALIRAPGMKLLCAWMIRAHCHRVIKLSGTLGKFAPEKELVENVHGVRGKFLEIGDELKDKLLLADGANDPVFGSEADPSVYFIGKMLWSKGLGSLMELLKYAEDSAGLKLKVDMYGGGPDMDAADEKAKKLGLDMPFHGPIDHPELGWSHKIFINPSTSEVLCTTVAEAIAMNKFVILPSHPSNDFFAQFPNCLPYATKEEFVGNLYYALTHSPVPLTEEYSYALTWEAATERLEAAGCITVKEAEAMEEFHASEEAGIDIDLPPLIENEKQKQQILETFKKSRERYRNFRSKLKQDIEQSNVLPKELQKRMTTELDKRLDLDLDEVLESPKLKLQLSPAELDKQLLDLYTKISEGPSGDVFRVIGGGANVGRQNLYMKQQARNQSKNGLDRFSLPMFAELEDIDDRERTTAQWVKLALNRALPKNSPSFAKRQASSLRVMNRDSTKMFLAYPSFARKSFYEPINAVKTVRFGSTPPRPPRSISLSLLI